jgi:hypothetical protein
MRSRGPENGKLQNCIGDCTKDGGRSGQGAATKTKTMASTLTGEVGASGEVTPKALFFNAIEPWVRTW